MTTYSDDLSILVTNAQTGNYDAFNGLVRRFQDMAVGYAYAIIGDFQLAEDAAQEAFVGAWLELPRLREPAAFAGWFRKLVFMRCSRQTRALRRGVVSTEALELIDPAPSAATVLDDVDRRRQVYRALAGLSDEERLVTVLFYIGRHTHAEISSFLDLPRETINNRLRAARKHLETGLIDMAQDEFHQHAPSRNDGFATRVATLSQPEAMNTERYVYGVVPMNGRDAWALFCASAAGDLARVRDLLDRDANLVNAQYWYQFPIHMAAREGHADVVQVLLEEGADPGQSRYTYNSWDKLLEVANDRDHRAVSKLLQTVMAERFGYDERFTELAAAIRDRDRARIDALLGATPDLINHADALGNGPLHWAALTRQLDLIDRFHELGADIDGRRPEKSPAFGLRGQSGLGLHGQALPLDRSRAPRPVPPALRRRCARPGGGRRVGGGELPTLELLAKLLDHGLDPNRPNWIGRTFLHVAAEKGSIEVAEALLEAGADFEVLELEHGGTPLAAAAREGQVEMVGFLLKKGADPATPPESP